MDKRELLRPYKKQRLGFEGVLIHIIQPNKKNNMTYGLVFASLYAPNEGIELDHAVIEMERATYNQINIKPYTPGSPSPRLDCFKRYTFTAKVNSYYKTGRIIGTPVQQECFMLQDINPLRLKITDESQLIQPTLYTQTRINNVMLSKTDVAKVRYTEDQLNEIVTTMPNDGTVEEFISVYTRSHHASKFDAFDIIDIVYQ